MTPKEYAKKVATQHFEELFELITNIRDRMDLAKKLAKIDIQNTIDATDGIGGNFYQDALKELEKL